jgi:hypothetical protein
MNETPDVIGYKLEEALSIINSKGATVSSVSLTAPPRDKKTGTDFNSRVVRIKRSGENVYELTVVSQGI